MVLRIIAITMVLCLGLSIFALANPVEKEQEIIRIVNRLYKQGKGIATIARKLTKLGYKTRRSKEFSALQVRRIIKDYQPVYNYNGRKAREIRKFILSVA